MIEVHCREMKNAATVHTRLTFFEAAYIFLDRLLILGEVFLHLLSSGWGVIYVGLVILSNAVSALSIQFPSFHAEGRII